MAVPPDFVAGQVLTAAQMNKIGMWLVKTDTIATGASSHIITGAFNADYVNYRIIINTITCAAGSPNLVAQLRVGATTAATTYYWGGMNSNYINRTDENAANTTSWKLGAVTTVDATAFNFTVYRPFLAAPTTYSSLSQSSLATYQIGGYHNQATSYDQLVLTPASSTLSNGTIYVYGMRD
jgi:hypothetical protein